MRITSKAAINQNRLLWDRLAQIHARSRSKYYDVDAFRSGVSTLRKIERKEVGLVHGKTLLHLMCHIGLDTLSWARLGAMATGVDFSSAAIEEARALAADLEIDAEFLQSKVDQLPDRMTNHFDIVISSYGILIWIDDLRKWASAVARVVKPGGFFFLIDGHPSSMNLAPMQNEPGGATYYAVKGDYFRGSSPIREGNPTDFADPQRGIVSDECFVWRHTLSGVVHALINVGLTIESLKEYPCAAEQVFPDLRPSRDGYWRFSREAPRFPLMFSLRARKSSLAT